MSMQNQEHSPLPDWWQEGLHGFNKRQFDFIVEACNNYERVKAELQSITESRDITVKLLDSAICDAHEYANNYKGAKALNEEYSETLRETNQDFAKCVERRDKAETLNAELLAALRNILADVEPAYEDDLDKWPARVTARSLIAKAETNESISPISIS